MFCGSRCRQSTLPQALGPVVSSPELWAISATASYICVAPRRSQQVVFDVLFACASEK